MGCGNCRSNSSSVNPSAVRDFGTIQQNQMQSLKITHSSYISQKKASMSNYYQIGDKIGKGSFGFVRVATHRLSGQKRAIKSIKKSHIVQSRFHEEINMLKSTDHPNIVRLYEFYEDSQYYHLVTEYLAGGELFDYITSSNKLSESIAACFMKQILAGVLYCHSRKIVHRDLKPENLLLEKRAKDSNLKIIDFGESAIYGSERFTEISGTSFYMAPEVLEKDYDEKCDLWSCGVILYVLLSGRLPFAGKTKHQVSEKIRTGVYSLTGNIWPSISDSAKDLLGKLLDKDPTTRISAEVALEHPWIQEYSVVTSDTKTMGAALTNLRNFYVETRFQHAVLAFIASQLVSQSQCKQLTDMFKQMDKNGDGTLSKEEMFEAYKEIMGEEEALVQVDQIFEQVDVDQSGTIDYTEFIMASLEAEQIVTKANLQTAFKEFDRDKSGKIGPDELEAIFGNSQHSTVPVEVWEELVRQADQNGDGEIDLSEFKVLMMNMFKLNVKA